MPDRRTAPELASMPGLSSLALGRTSSATHMRIINIGQRIGSTLSEPSAADRPAVYRLPDTRCKGLFDNLYLTAAMSLIAIFVL